MAKRGPRPQYERIGANKVGAPTLSTRLDPAVYRRIVGRPEGPRAYVERLVTEDADRSGESLVGHQDGPSVTLTDQTAQILPDVSPKTNRRREGSPKKSQPTK